MRDYKFRGKRIDNGEWVIGSYTHCQDGEGHTTIIPFRANYHVPVDPKTVGQCVGLQDRNGKDIYEGDIVKQTYVAQSGHVYDGTDMTYTGHHIGRVVITARGVFLKNPLHYSEDTDETTQTNSYKQVAGYRSEVIGNVFVNPDLLGG